MAILILYLSAILAVATSRALPEVVCTNGMVRYFAFGSNLLRSKMEDRLQLTHAIIERMPALVTDHRLAFNMRMFPPLEPSMASIEPQKGEVCEGVLYTLTREGYEALWKSEGGSMERPGYEEIVVSVRRQLRDSQGDASYETVQAITLRAAPWMRLQYDVPPSARYRNLIVDGAKEVNLSNDYIARLIEMPVSAPSAALTAIAKAHAIVALLLFRLKLRKALTPLRAACYALQRGKSPQDGQASRLLNLGAELITGAILLPTAALGAVIRVVLRLCGRGPPSARSISPPALPKK